MTRQFTAVADPQGAFQLATGLAVPPGAGVKLDARGDHGTAMAAITAAPPSQLPRAGGLNPLIGLAIAASVLWCFFISALIAWGRQVLRPGFFRMVNLLYGTALAFIALRLLQGLLLHLDSAAP